MKTDSQNKQLAKWLKSGKTIAPLQALNRLGIYRLASRIFDLSNPPFNLNIDRKMIYTGKVKFAQYRLRKNN